MPFLFFSASHHVTCVVKGFIVCGHVLWSEGGFSCEEVRVGSDINSCDAMVHVCFWCVFWFMRIFLSSRLAPLGGSVVFRGCIDKCFVTHPVPISLSRITAK